MKNMCHIRSYLKREYPVLAPRLNQQDEITRFKNTFLTPLEREQILFIVPKNNQLLFAFKHKALCVEFNHYKHKHIIKTLKEHKESFPTLSCVEKVYAYVPSHILAPPPLSLPSVQTFYEHSDGNFENRATDSKIYEKIEALRLGIKRQWDAQNEQ
ncbi:hypothetical protein OQH61_02285 [Helicobacter sp. MIT 21-1697]|uniref:hypothetical protein n=1 Tax=Helicobacter sp. MIT 21-1697 TaxID=2993733 RepID=UPI00224AFAB4|nr:hypothetical protein [Helicobacter sp. MIT 21-1697]MCX2716558.1 hypothetical protein [Helicobacter sp. MIT 21-1697]